MPLEERQTPWYFFKAVKRAAKHVIYVPGNHEYYGQEFHKANAIIREFCEAWDIHLLLDDKVQIEGVPFIGGTLWTDIGTLDAHTVEQGMNDYRRIKIKGGNNYRKLRVTDTVALHWHTRSFLFSQDALYDAVVVTHHLPAKQCVHPKYALDRMSAAFYTDLEEQIRTYQPRLWIHGHTHEQVDIEVGVTRIVANPRGYIGYELQAENYGCRVIEV